MTKAEIRKEIKIRIAALPKEELQKESEALCKKLLASNDYISCTTLLAYMPLPDEADITPLISDALNHNKQVFLPRITPCTNQMEFYRYTKATHTAPGSFGITEPAPDESQSFLNFLQKQLSKSQNSQQILMLFPGRAFTKDGRRLGRGKGFYDIYFSRLELELESAGLEATGSFTGIKKSGVCFACQLVAVIPTTPDDVMMDSIFCGQS